VAMKSGMTALLARWSPSHDTKYEMLLVSRPRGGVSVE
jgi:hypothetical protein